LAESCNSEHFNGIQPTSLIGREEAIDFVKKQILRENIRLLTLTGTAGVGKTRLALGVLDAIRPKIAQIIFVDLAPITDSSMVLQKISRSCGVITGSDSQLLPSLIQSIGTRPMLLVLDNCEHVLDAITALSTLLASCPNLKILTTSREILRLKWEVVFSVPPLPVPNLAEEQDLHSLSRVPSVALFIQRAKARNANFAFKSDNARAISELCVRLDGIPLAIELAATQVGAIGLEAILVRFGNQLILETSNTRDAPAHHQSLRAAIDWSYRLLDAQEKELFGLLSVFSNEWTLESAEEICSRNGLDKIQIPHLLMHLVDCSIVMVNEQPDGSMRYHFPEVIREYAREQLKKMGKEDALQRSHRDWFLMWAELREPDFWGPKLLTWLDQIETEFNNLWAALEWSCITPGESSGGLRLFAALSRFWDLRDRFSEGRSIASRLLSQTRERTLARARTLNEVSLLAYHQMDIADSQKMVEESLVLASEMDDIFDIVGALLALGSIALTTGDMKHAISRYNQAVRLSRLKYKTEPRAIYYALFWRGQLTCLQGDNEQAVILLEEALTLARRQGDLAFTTVISIWLGRAQIGLGEFELAKNILLERLHACQELRFWELVCYCLDFLGQAYWALKDQQGSIRLFGTASALRQRIGVVRWYADSSYENTLAAMHNIHGNNVLSSSQETVRNLTLNDAVAWAINPNTQARSAATPWLTAREMDVAKLVAAGLSNRSIAGKLFISKRTVDAHLRHILNKLELNTRAQVSAWYTSNQTKK